MIRCADGVNFIQINQNVNKHPSLTRGSSRGIPKSLFDTFGILGKEFIDIF